MKTRKQQLKLIPPILLLVLLYSVTACPIKLLTGVSCFGCGMTRACLAVLRLDFSSAWFYHPLYPVMIVFPIVYYLRKLGHIRLYRVSTTIIILLFILVYCIRLPDRTNYVVVFEPENGLIWRGTQWIISHFL